MQTQSLLLRLRELGKSEHTWIDSCHGLSPAFTILKNIRGIFLDKLPKLPLGTVMDTSSGKMMPSKRDGLDETE